MSRLIEQLAVRVRETQRRAVRFFGGLTNRDFEYDFAYRNIVGENVRVLDVGSTQSLLPLRLAQRGYEVTTFDYRPYHEKHPHIRSITGDFLHNSLPDRAFDYVVMISTIEHIGFGSYGAPQYVDGDFMAMEEAKRILAPDGKIVLTFPMASRETIIPEFERWYDVPRIRQLFEGLYLLSEEYYIPGDFLLGRAVKWLPASLQQIVDIPDVVEAYGYQCNACYVVSPQPRQLTSPGIGSEEDRF